MDPKCWREIQPSIVTSQQREYSEQVILHSAVMKLHVSLDGCPLTNNQIAENLLLNRHPYDPDYAIRLYIVRQLEEGKTPEQIATKRPSDVLAQGDIGLLYEYRDSKGMIVYTGYTTATINKRHHNHKWQPIDDPFHQLLRNNQLTPHLVGLGSKDDENTLITKRFITLHPILNSEIAYNTSLDLYVIPWQDNRQLILLNGDLIIRRWNPKTFSIEYSGTLSKNDVQNCRRLQIRRSNHRRLSIRTDKQSRIETQYSSTPTIETICSICGTLGLALETEIHEPSLAHISYGCCGQSSIMYSPQQIMQTRCEEWSGQPCSPKEYKRREKKWQRLTNSR